ncbi:MAG: M20/M25/M40 family metallo-hydrolase [Bacteroidota bacterium]
MKKVFFAFALLIIVLRQNGLAQNVDSIQIAKIFSTALKDDEAYHALYDLCKHSGKRISGSPLADTAVIHMAKWLKNWGADSVWLQECMVPHWVRGEKEEAKIISSVLKMNLSVPVCALGMSVGTPADGIKAGLIEVHGMGELKKMNPADIKGKIVFYNGPMDPATIFTFNAYGNTVGQRWGGAMEAAKYGAIGVVVRSVASHIDSHPHTGSMGYNDSIPKIPAVAISTEAAEKLSAALKEDKNCQFWFKSSCQTLPDVKSHNVIAEIKGSKYPNEIIVVGGHLDAWDMAEGAHDDGAGVVHSMEVIRLFKVLGIKPQRTIRVVLFMNEENGTRGAKAYAEWAKTSGEKHIAAIESDAGGFTPRGFTMDCGEAYRDFVEMKFAPILSHFGVGDFSRAGGGADVGHLRDICPVIGELAPDSQRYFDHHHSELDVFEEVNDRELELGAASMASFVYLLDKYGTGTDRPNGGDE